MNLSLKENNNILIRPLLYRDWEVVESLVAEDRPEDGNGASVAHRQLENLRRWYGILKLLSFFPNPCQHDLCVYVAELEGTVCGLIQVAPFNKTRSTWRVERVIVAPGASQLDVGSQLLRHCFETIWEARTWIIEVNVNDSSTLALYRQNGFQPLAQMTYWAIAAELLADLAAQEPDLPNLLPVSNADAQLLYQLDTVSMPPLLRQVFDRHILDFKTSFLNAFLTNVRQWLNHSQKISSYVFEPQRKAAIGYFKLQLAHNNSQLHQAQLTVHPAYTWLYPKLLSQMAQIVVQTSPHHALQLASADYQPEREEYLEKIGANRIEHTLLMSRSVWHKLRETKPVSLEGLQLSEVLQGLQPARTPIPTRMSWLKSVTKLPNNSKLDISTSESTLNNSSSQNDSAPTETNESTENGHLS
ncbi:GNAT family N-acetyltransferase [Oscillatoria salina]|uniref:GNAT family N-acetyltransferase n=1 Tax=Oscillatoria salina TaxID=331517 RepID=UPI0013B6975F|nr:GNAT family N-acetyltransferase [Oscillatoria salina]MBZ8180762.1 GNAT family N-acetyltransferase [Oscillatoria salina IIICB1]NET88252.1 GNAT family N-acetyltransferase [Kamptonema sp. SIO1D9]